MNSLWSSLGALAGYALIMFSNPIRPSLRDGLRAIRRYPALWVALGLFGFGYALFEILVRLYFSYALQPGEGPIFIWSRAAFHPDLRWLAGQPDSLWTLPSGALREIAREAILPALDNTAGLFNNLVSTFPISAFAALLLLCNAGRRQAVLLRALRKRFGAWGWVAHAAILLCALAAIAKPLLLLVAGNPFCYQWSPVVAWLGFLFEYLFGIYVQVYLILLAYCWVRGLNFDHQHLLDFAIRRSSFVLRWAVVVMLLSTLLIDLPLILKNFPALPKWLAVDLPADARRLAIARSVLDAILIFFAATQITLVFHSESLRKALRDHGRLIWKNAWAFAWLLVLAALHFYLLHALDLLCRMGFGEGTALWVSWRLLFPWLAGGVSAWLLAGWVCVFKRGHAGQPQTEDLIHF